VTDYRFQNWSAARVWLWVSLAWFLAFAWFETRAILAGTDGTLTATVRHVLVFTRWRYLITPLWTWLTWHWFLQPQRVPVGTWRDVAAVAVGLLAAFLLARWHR